MPLPYQEPGRPVEDRANDLLARMTLEEKTAQMHALWLILPEDGHVLNKQGKSAAAEDFYRQACDMRRKLFPDGSPELANNLNQLGNLLFAEVKLAEAERVHREALAMDKKLFPIGHKLVAGSLANPGSVLEREGKLDEAENLYLQEANGTNRVAARAQYGLALLYASGGRDLAEAAKWYRRAADQGYAAGQYMLGRAYANGLGVPRDVQEAVKWYRKAAEKCWHSFTLSSASLV